MVPTQNRQGRTTKVRLFSHIKKFIFVGYFSYLCVMNTYLKTPTSTMTVHQIRKVVKETIKWCELNLGKKSYPLNYSVRTLGKVDNPAYGVYNYNIRTMTIFRDYCPTIKMVICSVLHEYTHYLQNLRHYESVLKRVGYDKHPQEIEARGMENLYSVCWKDIKNKI